MKTILLTTLLVISTASFADQESLLQMWNSPTMSFNNRMVEQQQADSMRDLAESMRNIERIQRQQLQLQQQQYQENKSSDVFKN